jgi:hypothetical protein
LRRLAAALVVAADAADALDRARSGPALTLSRDGVSDAGRRREAEWPTLVAGAAIGVWGWRLELGLLVLALAVTGLLARLASSPPPWRSRR